MKHLVLLVCFALTALAGKGQQFYVSYGRHLSTFDYRNSNGDRLDNLSGASNNYMSLGYRAPIAQQKWFVNAGASYTKYGAKGSDPSIGKYYSWDVSYIGVHSNIEFEFYKQQSFFKDQDGLSFYAKAGISVEFLVQGTQVINDQLFRLNGVEQFDRPVFFVRGGVGANYCVSRRLAVFLEYMGGKSFNIFGSSSGDDERLRYNSHIIRFGLLVSLPPCDYCHTTL